MSRGYRNIRPYRSDHESEDQGNYWMSYSDLMAAFLIWNVISIRTTVHSRYFKRTKKLPANQDIPTYPETDRL